MSKPQAPRARPARALLDVLRRFRPELRQQRALLAGAALAAVAETALRLVEPWALKVLFDALLAPVPNPSPWLRQLLDALGPRGVLVATCSAIVLLAVLRAAAAYASTVGFTRAGSRIMAEVRAGLFRHLQCLSLSFHQRARGGDLVLRLIQDVGQLQDILVTALVPLATRLLLLAGMVALMLALNLRLALLALALLPLLGLRGLRLGRGIHDVARSQRRREGQLAATAAESLGALPVVQALSLQDRFSETFGRRSTRASRADLRGKRLSAQLERSVDVFIALATALALGQGTLLVWQGAITPGDLLVFVAYLKAAFRPLQDSAKYSTRLAKAAAAGERVLALLNESPGVADRPGARPAPPFRGEVRFHDVSFRYPSPDPGPGRGLQHVSFTAAPGRILALVGASGSGKSTILALVSRLHDPDHGSITIDGHDLRDLTLASLRTQIGVVLQDTGLFAGTVADNLRAGREDASDDEVLAAARLAQADEFIRQLPLGYDTPLGERGVSLSHGQRQRLAIARAALRRTPILLLDEPTAGLDEPSARLVFEGLRGLASRATVILATHHPREAAQADAVLHLDHGRTRPASEPESGPLAPAAHAA